MGHGAEALHVMLDGLAFRIDAAVETTRHEVGATAFFQQATRRHVHAGRTGHQGVRVFDAAIVLRCAQLPVGAHAVELEQPVFKAGLHIELARSYLIGCRIPGNSRLGPCATRRCSNLDDLGQSGFGELVRAELAMHGLPGALDQAGKLDGRTAGNGGSASRLELERTHAAFAHIGQTIEGFHL